MSPLWRRGRSAHASGCWPLSPRGTSVDKDRLSGFGGTEALRDQVGVAPRAARGSGLPSGALVAISRTAIEGGVEGARGAPRAPRLSDNTAGCWPLARSVSQDRGCRWSRRHRAGQRSGPPPPRASASIERLHSPLLELAPELEAASCVLPRGGHAFECERSAIGADAAGPCRATEPGDACISARSEVCEPAAFEPVELTARSKKANGAHAVGLAVGARDTGQLVYLIVAVVPEFVVPGHRPTLDKRHTRATHQGRPPLGARVRRLSGSC